MASFPYRFIMITSIHSQEIFATGMFTASKSSLKHRCKHVLRWLSLYGDQALTAKLMSQSIPTGYILGQPPGISSKTCPGVSGFHLRKLPRGREFDKGRDYVENEIETSKRG